MAYIMPISQQHTGRSPYDVTIIIIKTENLEIGKKKELCKMT
jgi:hypothetical protein